MNIDIKSSFFRSFSLTKHINCMFYGLPLAQLTTLLSPALIQSTDTMKCLLDSMLVLTKQDRLCHVIHATSDPFYQTWLRQFNVMQHCKVCFLVVSLIYSRLG